MTDGRRAEVQLSSCSAGIPLLKQQIEHQKEVEIAARELSVIQHSVEIIPFDSWKVIAAFEPGTIKRKGNTMIHSFLRSILMGLAAATTTMIVIAPTMADASPPMSRPVQGLADAYAQANALLLQGDSKAWSQRMPLSKDFVLFSPFGGTPSRYADYTPERIERMGRFFKNGMHQQEIVEAYASDDMIVLATIERDTVEVGGLPSQQWALRVTSVFRRDGDNWKLAHRHADPLVDDISLAESAKLARGERMTAGK